MSSFPTLERMAIRFAILLPNDVGEYHVYYTDSFESAHSLLSLIERSIIDAGRDATDERPFMAVMTTDEILPDINLLFVPIRNQSTVTPKILPVTGESSLYETSKDDVRQNMVILLVKHKVSVFKSANAHEFIETVGIYIERSLQRRDATR